MGIDISENEKNKLNFNINDLSFIDENKVKRGENLIVENLEILWQKAKKSIWEAIKDKGYGTGFFCKIKYPNKYDEIYCLITNNHVITKNMLIYKENIEINF